MKIVLGLVIGAICSRELGAQRLRDLSAAVAGNAESVRVVTSPLQDSSTGSEFVAPLTSVPKPLAPVASAVLPGAGQLVLHQDRFLAYIALEGFLWLQYAKDLHESRDQRNASVDLALRVARAPYVLPAHAPDAGWDYYERLEDYVQSGSYTVIAGKPVPDTTVGSYNAFVWLQARLNHWANPNDPPPVSSPAYQAALAEYAARATQGPFQWSWVGHQLEQDLYRASINKKNDAFRHATSEFGVILANHILSLVDAFATVRIQSIKAGGQAKHVSATVPIRLF